MPKKLLAMVKQITADEYLSLVPHYVDFEGDKILQFTDAQGRNVGLRFAFRNEFWVCYSLFEIPEEDEVPPDSNILLFIAQAIHYGASLITLEEDHTSPPEAKLMVQLSHHETLQPLDMLKGAAEMAEAVERAKEATKQ